MMQTISLDGSWQLSGAGAGNTVTVTVTDIDAAVPGNIELDLCRAKIIPDPFWGDNAARVRPYEFFDWQYRRDFFVPADFPEGELIFEGIDGIAVIELNGQHLGEAQNAFMPHRFTVGRELRRGGKNTLTVRLTSPVRHAANRMLDHQCFAHDMSYENLEVRKPGHEYGWDIAPRFLLGGLYKKVLLRPLPGHEMLCCYFDTLPTTTPERAELAFSYSFRTALDSWDFFEMTISGCSGKARFEHKQTLWFTAGFFKILVPSPRLWFPAAYGKPNRYEVKIEVSHAGEHLFTHNLTIGIRTVKLLYDENPDGKIFRFEVNHVPIMIKGVNHVPADAFHSRDAERLPLILELIRRAGCNMIRVWGGGVYESTEFYDYCDRHGILVWQDFMMACACYPDTEQFWTRLRPEIEWAVRHLRQHPSLALWAGDNEVDMKAAQIGDGRSPANCRITRELILQVLARLDPGRPYLPSSPYLSDTVWARNLKDGRDQIHCPEQHVWGSRDYAKAPFYAQNEAAFISETGFHGMPAEASIRKFISEEHLWPWQNDPHWEAHSTFYPSRNQMMADQLQEFFGIEPQNLGEMVKLSQICQAEALKFFIERARMRKWQCSGIIWWNMIDCWPQFSDAAVDYYFTPKLAYHVICRIQQPLHIMLGEPRDWAHDIVVGNDQLQAQTGDFEIKDFVTGENLYRGNFSVAPNGSAVAGRLRLPRSQTRLLRLDWRTASGQSSSNYYLTGAVPHDPKLLQSYYPKLLMATGILPGSDDKV